MATHWVVGSVPAARDLHQGGQDDMLRYARILSAPLWVWAPFALSLVACGADAILTVPSDSQSRTIVATVGQEVRITLGNVGPAKYESPPQISSTAISYVGVEVIPPFTPAGPTQQFRFRAARPGDAVVHFRRLLGDSVVFVVEDTIRVR